MPFEPTNLAATVVVVALLAPAIAVAQTSEPPPDAPADPAPPQPEASPPEPASPEAGTEAPPPTAPPVPKVTEPLSPSIGAEVETEPAAVLPQGSQPMVLEEPAAARTDADGVIDGIRAFSFNPPGADLRVKPVAEFGALFVVKHQYQGGSDGTDFNLRRDGGQATAFLSWRISAELELFERHQIILLYQPIDLRTRATLTEDLRVNGLTFPSGTPMQFRYGFDFYRLSYMYDFMPEAEDELAIGLSLQLRVANLEFSSLDGTLQRTSQNLGPVPLLKFRGRYTFDNDIFIGTEIDGIGIQFPSDQGSVLGLFFDTSIRAGYSPTAWAETYLNLRYLGGGARGPGSEPLSSEFGDGFNDNFIHALNLSVGFAVK